MPESNDSKKLDLAQKGCAAVGVDPITSFTEGSAAANVLEQMYEPIVSGELSVFPWHFSTQHFNLEPNLLATDPLLEVFDTGYQMPTAPAVLSIDGVFIGEDPINFGRYQDEIHTNGTGEDDVILKYRYRSGEIEWTPYFDLLIIYRLAAIVASSVAKDGALTKAMIEVSEGWYIKAKRESSQSQPKRPLRLTGLARQRGGRIVRFWRDR